MNTVTLNMNMFLSNTGFTRRNMLIVFFWLRHMNTWIPSQHVGLILNSAHPVVKGGARFLKLLGKFLVHLAGELRLSSKVSDGLRLVRGLRFVLVSAPGCRRWCPLPEVSWKVPRRRSRMPRLSLRSAPPVYNNKKEKKIGSWKQGKGEGRGGRGHIRVARPRMLFLACLVTVFLLSGPAVFGCLGKTPGETRFF